MLNQTELLVTAPNKNWQSVQQPINHKTLNMHIAVKLPKVPREFSKVHGKQINKNIQP